MALLYACLVACLTLSTLTHAAVIADGAEEGRLFSEEGKSRRSPFGDSQFPEDSYEPSSDMPTPPPNYPEEAEEYPRQSRIGEEEEGRHFLEEEDEDEVGSRRSPFGDSHYPEDSFEPVGDSSDKTISPNNFPEEMETNRRQSRIGEDSCMTDWLKISLPEVDSFQLGQFERALLTAPSPIDENTIAFLDPSELTPIFQNSDFELRFADCLRHGEGCQGSHACENDGKCLLEQSGASPLYVCECEPGFDGDRCQLAPTTTPVVVTEDGGRPTGGSTQVQPSIPESAFEEFSNFVRSQLASIQSVLSTVSGKVMAVDEQSTDLKNNIGTLKTRVDTINDLSMTKNLEHKNEILNKVDSAQSKVEELGAAARVRDMELATVVEAVRAQEDGHASVAAGQAKADHNEVLEKIDNFKNHVDGKFEAAQKSEDENIAKLLSELKPVLPRSCKEIKDRSPSSPTGFYDILSSHGETIKVKCEMDREGGGWTRVASIDPAHTGTCPGDMRLQNPGQKVCTRSKIYCSEASFAAVAGAYSEVLGFVTGYRDKSTDAFKRLAPGGTDSIDGPYVDGVSVTRGTPKKHLWSYASSFQDASQIFHCPCSGSPGAPTPDFVGGNYYCTDIGHIWNRWTFNNANHLWTATSQCAPGGTCCDDPKRPWFVRDLQEPTTDAIQVRACNDQPDGDENVGIDRSEIYVRLSVPIVELDPLPASCKEIKERVPSSPSGNYEISSPNGATTHVFCEMEREGGGWTRVANIDPAATSSCPGDMKVTNPGLAMCTRSKPACGTAQFISPVGEYSEIMGFVAGYRDRSTDAFNNLPPDGSSSINGAYVDGVSVTRGSPRKHVWTYTASFGLLVGPFSCPCSKTPGANPPAFVGQDYYCNDIGDLWNRWTLNDASHLWSSTSECTPGGTCCDNSKRPWFTKHLAKPTTDSIEIRVCVDQSDNDENVGIDKSQMFVR